MRADSCIACVLCLLGWIFTGSVIAAEPGVVVEEIGAGSALEKAGVRPGDVLYAWERLPNPPANPEAAKGEFASPFDWLWFEIEEAPRGVVRLLGEETEYLVQPLTWSSEVRANLPAVELALYTEGREFLAAEEYAKGVQRWLRLRNRLVESGDETAALWTALRIAKAWAAARRWEDAEAAYGAALAEAPGPRARIALWDARARTYRDQNAFDQAEEAYNTTLELRREACGKCLGVARSIGSLGVLAFMQGDLDTAEKHLEAVLALRNELAPGSFEAMSGLNGVGVLAWRRGDLMRAEHFFRRAVQIRHKLEPGTFEMAIQLNNLGSTLDLRGELEMAEEALLRALEIHRELDPESPDVAKSLNNLASVMFQQGRWEKAAVLVEEALEILEKVAPESLELALGYHYSGHVAKVRGQLDLAEQYLSNSLAIRRKLAPESMTVAGSLDGLGGVAWERGELDLAARYFSQAVALGENQAPDSSEHASTLHSAGELATAREDYPMALELLLRSQAIKAAKSTRTALEADTLHALGELNEKTHQTEQAVHYYLKALESLESQIGKLSSSQDVRTDFRARNRHYYRAAIRALRGGDLSEEAFHVLERSRARGFLELLAERELTFSADLPAELEARRRRVTVEYDRTQQQLLELQQGVTSAEHEALAAKLGQLRERYEGIAAEIRRASPKLAALQYPEPLDLDGARAALDPGTVLLSYSVGEDETHLFATTAGGKLRALALPAGDEDLRDRIGRFRDLVAQARPDSRHGQRRLQDLDREARELYRTLLAPVADEIERGERLLVLPDGPLHLLPWSALVRPDGKYLVEWKPHHVALSATVYAELRRERPREKPSDAPLLTAFGDPVYPPRFATTGAEISDVRVRAAAERGFGFEPLPGTRREVERIAALYDEDATTVYLGAEATEEHAKSASPRARYLHFATHGLLDERFPLNSGLALTIPDELAEGSDNGLLQAWEIFESVRLDADLVVLSACESALGREVGGEGLIGLTRAFQYAGARSVVASLWQVADESTAILMEHFYHHLRAGKAKDEALRAAQLDLLRGAAQAPYAWAAFQLHGDWR